MHSHKHTKIHVFGKCLKSEWVQCDDASHLMDLIFLEDGRNGKKRVSK
jgi:hypothetical protein